MRRSRSGRNTSVPAISTISSASMLISPCDTRQAASDKAAAAPIATPQSVMPRVITPVDIERIAGITGGNIFHGELLLHQLFFMRPATQWAGFRTPIEGYYLAGSGAHPGGGIMGAPGKLAAEVALKDLG